MTRTNNCGQLNDEQIVASRLSKKYSQVLTRSYAMMLGDRLVIVGPGAKDGFTDTVEPARES
jgi:hypothetical protein